jgi:hypothetical protein
MTDPVQVLRGVAVELAGNSAALYSLSAYPADPTLPAVFLGALAPAPILSVAVAHYDTNTRTDSHNPLVRIQLRWRAKSLLLVEGAADRGFRALHFFEPTDPPRTYPNGLHVQRCRRIVTVPAEKDANSNWERADSYEFTLNP